MTPIDLLVLLLAWSSDIMGSSSASLATGEDMFDAARLARLRGRVIVRAPFLTCLMPCLIDLLLEREVVEGTERSEEREDFVEGFMKARGVSERKKGRKKRKKEKKTPHL